MAVAIYTFEPYINGEVPFRIDARIDYVVVEDEGDVVVTVEKVSFGEQTYGFETGRGKGVHHLARWIKEEMECDVEFCMSLKKADGWFYRTGLGWARVH